MPQMIVCPMKQRSATAMPRYPICSARIVSFSCRGVSSRSVASSARMRPHSECSPTAVTRYVQSPSVTVLPDTMNGFSLFLEMVSVSPVMADSSILHPLPFTKIPSAGTLAPVSRLIKSPTMIPSALIRTSTPLRRTTTAQSSCCSCSPRNCFSLLISFHAVMLPMRRQAEKIAAPSSHPMHESSSDVISVRSTGPPQMGFRGHPLPRSA
mmetsp:Transcript_27257/g.64986  ORF Transcript_27257/g.64986 Transcript_27257/m.64986 type:complete len:210 (-) Transcript_27257:525-1154(-)